MHPVFTAPEGKIQGQPGKSELAGREGVLSSLPGLPVPRVFLFALQVDKRSPFYGHNENSELQVHFFPEGLVFSGLKLTIT